MTTRELPSSEWAEKLAGTGLEPIVSVLEPANTKVLVVEDEQGKILACWALMRFWHAEGVWIHPDFRKRTSVARRLLTAMTRLIRSCGALAVMTGAETDDVRHLLTTHLKATRLPDQYVWRI